MVRLEDCVGAGTNRKTKVSIPIWCDWKLPRPDMADINKERFNSYMVRLEASGEVINFSKTSMFQFLYGAIGSNLKTISLCENHVSIPIWCDWKITFREIIMPGALFQFLYGAIGRPPPEESLLLK